MRATFSLQRRIALVALVPALGAAILVTALATGLDEDRVSARDSLERLEAVRDVTELSYLARVDALYTLAIKSPDPDVVLYTNAIEPYKEEIEDDITDLAVELRNHADRLGELANGADVAFVEEVDSSLAAARATIDPDDLTRTRFASLPDDHPFYVGYQETIGRLDALAASIADASGGGEVTPMAAAIASLVQAEEAMVDESVIVFSALFQGELDETTASQVQARADRQELLIETVTGLYPGVLGEPIRSYLDGPEESRWLEVRAEMLRLAAGEEVSLDVVEGGFAAADRIGEFNQARDRFAGLVVTKTSHTVEDAERTFRNAVVFAALLAVLSAGLCLAVGRSVSRNLEFIRHRARQLGEGTSDVGAEGLAVHESVFRDVASEIDAASSTLAQVERSTVALAAGVPDPAASDVPGPIGEALVASGARMDVLSRRLRHSEELARSIVDASNDAILTVDRDGLIRSANPAAVRLCGVPITALLDASLDEVIGTDIASNFSSFQDQPLMLFRADGSTRTVIANGQVVAVSDGDRLLTVFLRDETERQELERQLLHEATHDPLTGAFNRATLLIQIERSRSRLERYGAGYVVVVFDIVGFHAVNDELGQRRGDAILQDVAVRIRREASPVDMLARLGGDQFVLISEEVHDEDSAHDMVRRVASSVTDGRPIAGAGMAIQLDAGLAWIDDPAVDPDEALRRATLALEAARASGDDIGLFEPSIAASIGGRLRVEREFRGALERNELHSEIQPVIDVVTGRVVGGELLARWTTADGEVRSPELFVPIAEESGLVVELDRWALDEACRNLAAWGRDPALPPLRIAANMSGRHLGDPRVLADVHDALDRHEVDPSKLTIELTETYLLQDIEVASAALNALRRLGIRIAIDDFGTGFSSLAYLRSLPVDEVKIDRSFVAGIDRDPSSRSIATMMTELAHLLGLEVVAEGVEQMAQLAVLREMGCRYVQGSIFSWSVDRKAFVDLAGRDWAPQISGSI